MKHVRLTVALGIAMMMLLMKPGSGQDMGPGVLGLSVSPAKMEISFAPGTTYNIPITIRNATLSSTHIQSTMVDFGLNQSGDYQFAKPGAKPYSLMRWATINPREFDLAPNNTQQVRVSLNVPKEALAGEYRGIIFFATRPTRQQHGVAFAVRIATTVYLTIPGTVKIGGAIAKMSAVGDSHAETYRVLFRNTGNAHVYLNGTLEIQKDGQTIDKIALAHNDLVERGQDRLLQVSGQALPRGKYTAVALIDYGGQTMTGGEIAFSKN